MTPAPCIRPQAPATQKYTKQAAIFNPTWPHERESDDSKHHGSAACSAEAGWSHTDMNSCALLEV